MGKFENFSYRGAVPMYNQCLIVWSTGLVQNCLCSRESSILAPQGTDVGRRRSRRENRAMVGMKIYCTCTLNV